MNSQPGRSVVVGSNSTQSNFLWLLLKTSLRWKTPSLPVSLSVSLYIYRYISMFIYKYSTKLMILLVSWFSSVMIRLFLIILHVISGVYFFTIIFIKCVSNRLFLIMSPCFEIFQVSTTSKYCKYLWSGSFLEGYARKLLIT